MPAFALVSSTLPTHSSRRLESSPVTCQSSLEFTLLESHGSLGLDRAASTFSVLAQLQTLGINSSMKQNGAASPSEPGNLVIEKAYTSKKPASLWMVSATRYCLASFVTLRCVLMETISLKFAQLSLAVQRISHLIVLQDKPLDSKFY